MKSIKNYKELKETFESAEKDFIKIFNKLIDSKNLSCQKTILLTRKLGLTTFKYYQCIIELELNVEKMIKIGKIIFSINNIVLIPLFFLFLLSPSLVTYLSIDLFLILAFIGKKIEKDGNDLSKALIRNENNLSILIEKCNNLLKQKASKVYENTNDFDELDNLNTLNFQTANVYLQRYLDEEELFDIDENIKEILIKILQDDLNTKEENLEILLEMAKEEVSYERLKNQSELNRLLCKNAKNN